MTKTKDLHVGDVVEGPQENPDILTVVVYVNPDPCDCNGHEGNTYVIVADFNSLTGALTWAVSEWCAASDDEFWTVVGQRLDLARKYDL